MGTATRGLIAIVLAVAPGLAAAERTSYGWLYGTDVLPERGAEVVTWIDEENGRDPDDFHATVWGFAGYIGITDQLLLGLPLEVVWRDSDSINPGFTWQTYGIEARYRFVSQDPVDAPPFAPLLRVGVFRDVVVRDAIRAEADLVASTTTPSGSIQASVDLGFVAQITPDDQHLELRPGLGVSFRVVGDLRLGAEAYAEVSLDDAKESWAVVGPNAAWTHGRSWISAAFGIGVYQIDTAPRVQWGIMF